MHPPVGNVEILLSATYFVTKSNENFREKYGEKKHKLKFKHTNLIKILILIH